MNRYFRLAIAGLLLTLLALSTPVLAQTTTFTISAGVDSAERGAITPSGAVKVAASGNQTFTVTPNPGYKIAYVSVDGKNQGQKTTFTFANVTADHTITAGFSPATYTIEAVAGPNGTVDPPSLRQYEYGSNQTYTIKPNPGYEISDVRVDGSQQGQITSYTFTDIQKDHNITVFFAAVGQGAVPGVGESTPPAASSTPPLPADSPSPFATRSILTIVAGFIAGGALAALLVILMLRRRRGTAQAGAAFTVKDLEISPRELRPGSKATVAVTVDNHGAHAGTFKITLKVDGITKGTKDVTIARGTSDRVEFTIPATTPGTFEVNVGNLAGTLVVNEA